MERPSKTGCQQFLLPMWWDTPATWSRTRLTPSSDCAPSERKFWSRRWRPTTGHIFKLTGDGFLAEFPSVIDAVECAAVVQKKLAEKNSAIEEDLRIDVRMGINIGEVIVEDDDRYGEGVNIAARLQELADPGGIWVSAKVAGEVGKKLPFELESVGLHRLKNMEEPIGAFRVKLDKARNRVRVKPRNPSAG